jgi:hypothetical protein
MLDVLRIMAFAALAAREVRPSTVRDAASHPIEPGAKRIADPD